MAEEMVRVYDFETKATTLIPSCELASGMIRVQIQGKEGEVWVDSAQLKRGEVRHPPFPDEVRDRFRRFQTIFYDVYPKTLEEWEDGFRRDADPEKEIAIWERIANVFEYFTGGRKQSAEQRRDIFNVILTAVTNGPEHVLATAAPVAQSRKRVREIIAYMFPGKG